MCLLPQEEKGEKLGQKKYWLRTRLRSFRITEAYQRISDPRVSENPKQHKYKHVLRHIIVKLL